MEKTPWFPADVNPVRDGLYEVDRLVSPGFPKRTKLYWSNKRGWIHTKHSGSGMYEGFSACLLKSDGDKWRGLASKP